MVIFEYVTTYFYVMILLTRNSTLQFQRLSLYANNGLNLKDGSFKFLIYYATIISN